MNKIQKSFKKLLGTGRAWRTLKGLTSEILDVFISPASDLQEYLSNLKYVHFPSKYLNENNIKNSEEFWGFKNTENKTLEERANNVQGQWSVFTGSQHFKSLEQILQKKGYPVHIIENIPTNNYSIYGSRIIANGYLLIDNERKDPIKTTTGKHSFIIQADDFLSEEQIKSLLETVVKIKPAHNACFIIPRFLRKKEIHNKLTRNQMQQYKKSQYCDVRSNGKF